MSTGTTSMQREQRTISPRVGHGTTCGKVILIGEHSVVFGEPAIAIPLLGITMHARISRDASTPWFESEVYSGPLNDMPAALAGIKAAMAASLEVIGSDDLGLNIRVESDVPAERGMGSSAAVAGAIVKALFDLHQLPLSQTRLFELVQVSERIAHGKPSGLDAVTTSSLNPVHFHQGNFVDLPINLSGAVVIADTGIKGGTRQTVAALRQRYEHEQDQVAPDIQLLGELTVAACECIANNELHQLGIIFDQAHNALTRLGVSSTELDHLVHQAKLHGALGAKMTGGGAGGCMLALCEDAASAENIASCLLRAGAHRVWIHSFEEHNAPEQSVKDADS